MANTLWQGGGDDKQYLQSGEFTSTIKTSLYIGGVDGLPRGIGWDGTDVLWTAQALLKQMLSSGVFTSTIKTSQLYSAYGADLTIASPYGICFDGVNNLFVTGSDADKLFLGSGVFTSTLKTSLDVSAKDGTPSDLKWDGTNTAWMGRFTTTMFLTSGKFTTTIKTSQDTGTVETSPEGMGWDGTNTPWLGSADDKLYLTSGQFTSTLKDSEYIGGIEAFPWGIDTDDLDASLGVVDVVVVISSELTLSATAEVVNIAGAEMNVIIGSALALGLTQQVSTTIIDVIITPITLTMGLTAEPQSTLAGQDLTVGVGSLSLGLAQGIPTVMSDAILLLPDTSMIILPMSLRLHQPIVSVTNDIKTIVTNARNFAISEYGSFAYNSMCKFNGKYLYAKADGIYEGGGDDDNGTKIEASYKTGSVDIFATEIQKLRNAYMNFRSDGDVQLFSVGDELNTRWRTIANSTPNTIHERRVKFERGIRQRHFNFGVSNINGSTLEIDSIKILTEPVRKRR